MFVWIKTKIKNGWIWVKTKVRNVMISTGIVTVALASGGVVADAQLNPYTDRVGYQELKITQEIDQGERVEISKTRAEFTMRGWNDEYAIKIIPQFGGSDFRVKSKRPLFSKRMEFTKGDVTAFIEPRTNNEFDIDFTLKTKPNTNIFTYKVLGADNFDFFYQPPLTQQEIDEGSVRPDNVIGSYAVYSKTKANHITGQTNYGAGKIMQIYKPEAVDANGNRVWAKLSYRTGQLAVIVPQSFLDTAVYPVRVDPTFGYTTVGGTAISGSNFAMFVRGTPASSGTVDSISFYAKKSVDNGNAKGVIWLISDLSIVTNSISPSVLINSTTAQWWVSTYSTSPSVVSGTDYYVGSVQDSANNISRYYDSGSTGDGGYDSNNYTTPTSLSNPFGNDNNKFSVYATYTASAMTLATSTTKINNGRIQINNGRLKLNY